MYGVAEILPAPATSRRTLTTAQKFARCRPRTASACDVQALLATDRVQVEVRRYRWDKPIAPTPFRADVCYLELALSPRPAGSEVDYLASHSPDAFVSTGNCSFIPAGYEAILRGQQGEQQVVGCLFEMEEFAPLVDWEWTPLEMSACFNISNTTIRSTLMRLAQEALNPDHASQRLVDALFDTLLVDLSRHIRATRNASGDAHGKLSARQLRLIERHITESCGAFPETTQLAEACGVSNRHLARMFKCSTGRTLSEYIAEVRIEKAKVELAQRGTLIKQIAYDCGFRSQSSFAQAFRRATGMTPRQYRTRNRA